MHKQLFPAEELELQPAMPNFSYIHKELLRNGVTLKLLWEEYVDQYRSSSKPYLCYSQFCKRYRDYVEANNLTTAITARLRNSTFLTLKDLNRAVAKELDTFNERPFTKREGSRRSVFLEEEQVYLHPLPTAVYEYADWTKATVSPDYHICVDHQYYSVPYQYVRKKVDVRLTGTAVEVFYQKTRIAMHARLTGKRHQYSTIAEHMPQNHQLYSLWDGKRFLRWAESVGPSTEQVIRHRLQAYQVEEQSYKSCIALLKLAETYTPQRLEQACALALSKDQAPRYNFIHGILQRKLDIKEQDTQKKLSQHAFIRGAAYYGGQYHEK